MVKYIELVCFILSEGRDAERRLSDDLRFAACLARVHVRQSEDLFAAASKFRMKSQSQKSTLSAG